MPRRVLSKYDTIDSDPAPFSWGLPCGSAIKKNIKKGLICIFLKIDLTDFLNNFELLFVE